MNPISPSDALFYEIIQADQRLNVPLSDANLHHLASQCNVTPNTRILELHSARGELLCQWAQRYDIKGTGVDDRPHLVRHANERANELEVWANLHFVESEVIAYPQAFHQYHIVAHFGDPAPHLTLSEVIATLRTAIHDEQGGVLLLGQLFWQTTPPPHVCEALGVTSELLPLLGDFITTLHDQELDLHDCLIATQQDWDAFQAQRWQAVHSWLNTHVAHPAHADIRHQLRIAQQHYFRYERQYLGWGVAIVPIPATHTSDDHAQYGDWSA